VISLGRVNYNLRMAMLNIQRSEQYLEKALQSENINRIDRQNIYTIRSKLNDYYTMLNYIVKTRVKGGKIKSE